MDGGYQLEKKTKVYVYLSHFLSAWGDRMWSFGVGLFLIELSPDSLRLTASYGFSAGVAVLLFGALIGDWIDNTPRLRAARGSLIVQNLLVCVCAIAVFFVFYYKDTITTLWPNEGLMKLFQAFIILTVILSRLASIAFKIAVEKDWIVEICGRDKDLLASMSATLRGIDLTTQILAPVVTGQIMAFTAVYYSAAFIAGWNLMSVVVEYQLIRKVYEEVPALKNKMFKKRKDKVTGTDQSKTEAGPSDENSKESPLVQDSNAEAPTPSPEMSAENQNKISQQPDESIKTTSESEEKKDNGCLLCMMRVFHRFITVYRGWRTYMKYDVAFAGLGLAFLYMTVLGFDSITVGYAYSQGLSEAILGGLQAAGAIVGIVGTFAYPRIRMKIGLERTGLFGLGAEVFCLCFCVASVWSPGSPFDLMSSSSDVSNTNQICSNISVTLMPLSNNNASNVNDSITTQGYDISSSLNIECNTATMQTPPDMSIWFLMIGIITARFGLWVADLTITQLFLETVEETERGIVNGVQSSLNQFMDMMKFLLVIILPKPHQFGLLVLISFSFIVLGWVLYAKYSHYSRGHLFHFDKISGCLDSKNNNIPGNNTESTTTRQTDDRDVSLHV